MAKTAKKSPKRKGQKKGQSVPISADGLIDLLIALQAAQHEAEQVFKRTTGQPRQAADLVASIVLAAHDTVGAVFRGDDEEQRAESLRCLQRMYAETGGRTFGSSRFVQGEDDVRVAERRRQVVDLCTQLLADHPRMRDEQFQFMIDWLADLDRNFGRLKPARLRELASMPRVAGIGLAVKLSIECEAFGDALADASKTADREKQTYNRYEDALRQASPYERKARAWTAAAVRWRKTTPE